jgi:hypothetical protein
MPTDVATPMTVRWYRNRRRSLLTYGLPALAPLALAAFLIIGEGTPGWTIVGLVALLVSISLLAGAALAGFGVARNVLIVRSVLGTDRRIPWPMVASFEVVQHAESGESVVLVVCTDGRRLHTAGCTFPPGPDGHSRAEAVAYELNTERIARADEDDEASPARRRPARLPAPRWVTPRRAHLWHFVIGLVAALWGLAFAVVLLVGGVSTIGPAIRASHNQGTRGSFVAVTEHCGRGCSWDGNFVLPDGSVLLRNVSFNAGTGEMSAGQSVAGLDTGDTSVVFPTKDSTQWLTQTFEIAIGVIWLAFALFVTVSLVRRELRTRRFHRSLVSPVG